MSVIEECRVTTLTLSCRGLWAAQWATSAGGVGRGAWVFLSLLESFSLESFAVQFAVQFAAQIAAQIATVWIALASGVLELAFLLATIACDKAATSCVGQCSGNGICESEAIALFMLSWITIASVVTPDITTPTACATWSLRDPQLFHSCSTVSADEAPEVQYVHHLLCVLGLANADAMKASTERP